MQNKMLDNVNEQIDDNLTNMIKLDSKLKGLLAKGSICKLWVIILIELALLILMLAQLI